MNVSINDLFLRGHDTPRRSIGHGARAVAFGAAVCLTVLLIGPATASAQQERLHQITWAHQVPSEVNHFVVLLSPVEGSVEAARQVDVGLPAAQTTGSLTVFSAMVAFRAEEFLAVAAVGHNGLMSVPSIWGGMPPTRPGQPMLVQP